MKKTRKWDYQAYKTEDGKKQTVHSRVGEKKYGYDKIPKDFVIHHIDEDKNNNQYFNLILLHKKDHKRVHVRKSLIIKSVKPSEDESEEE
tara:strand:+ start:538 stop:807 length:270 start_codon:yes stop_codon:yes gene_type:complete